ncbi:MAG: glycosyltransferase family 39 protein [Chloroflexi bacterium]|nr:glycosyltransferase family 39 protein [Chloroflexota bacterium]
MRQSLEQSLPGRSRTGPASRTFLPAPGEGAALILLIALCAVFLFVMQQNPAGYTLDGPADTLDTKGLYGIERNDQFAYRWSGGNTEARLPLRHNSGRRYIAVVTALAPQPEGPQPIRFLLNDRVLAETTPERALRTYRLLLDPAGGDAAMRFGVATRPFRAAGEGRDLGLMITRLEISPIVAIDWPLVLGAPAGLLAVWAVARRRTDRGGALAIVAVHTLALMATASLYRPDALPFFWLVVPVLVATAASAFIGHATPARIGLAALLALAGYSSVIWPAGFTDDAFISFQYARNLVAGHGLVFNPGERVEGYTNFLWTILAALVIRLGGDPVFWSYLAGMVIGLALVLLSYRIAARLYGPAWGLATALLVASSQSLLVYTTRGAGMETGLFAWLILLGGGLYLSAGLVHGAPVVTRRLALSGLVFALAALTRPEGIMLVGLTAGHGFLAALCAEPGGHMFSPTRLVRRGALDNAARAVLPLIAAFAAVFVPYFVWRLWYYGDLLPNTFYAKTGGGVQQWLRGLEYAAAFARIAGGPLLIIAVVAPFLTTSRQHPAERLIAALVAPAGYLWMVCLVYTAYIIMVGGDHFPGERFFVPLVAWLAMLITAGMATLAARPFARRAPRTTRLVLVGALAVAALVALNRGDTLDRRVRGNDESVWIWADLGLWLNQNTPPDASIAAGGIGAIAYYSQRETIDIYGLADRHIARVEVEGMGSGAAGHEKRDPNYVLNVRRPTYIPRIWEDYFGGAGVLRARYELIDIHTTRGYTLQLWRRLPDMP